jgi:hypothetical protein
MVVAQVLAGQGFIKSIKGISTEEGLELLAGAETERSVKFEGVLLLGDTATIEAGMALNSKIWRMQCMARGELSVDPKSWHGHLPGISACTD